MKSKDLLVIADCNPDLIVSGELTFGGVQTEQLVDAADLTVGGSGAITACGAARLGIDVATVGVMGDDDFGRIQRQRMQALGVDVSAVEMDPDLSTGLTIVLSPDGNRSLVTFPGSIAALTAERIDRVHLASARHVHVAAFYLQRGLHSGLIEVLRYARRQGATTSLDPNWDPSESWLEVKQLLPEVDFFMPNLAEAEAISGASGAESAGRELLGIGAGSVVIKCGREGAVEVNAEGLLRASPPQVDAVDATGAGDSFNAAYLAAFLRGFEPSDRLLAGCWAGALSTRKPGGTESQATWAEIEVGLS